MPRKIQPTTVACVPGKGDNLISRQRAGITSEQPGNEGDMEGALVGRGGISSSIDGVAWTSNRRYSRYKIRFVRYPTPNVGGCAGTSQSEGE